MSSNLVFTPHEVRSYYATRFPELKQVGGEFRGPCPVHLGTRMSFAVNPTTGEAFCHSQCGRGWDIIALERDLMGVAFAEAKAAVFAIVGRSEPNGHFQSRIVATSDYTDESGHLLFQSVRCEPKDFRLRRPGDGCWIWNIKGVRLVLYRLPAILARHAETIYVCEGRRTFTPWRAGGSWLPVTRWAPASGDRNTPNRSAPWRW